MDGEGYSLPVLEAEKFSLSALREVDLSSPKSWSVAEDQRTPGGLDLISTYETRGSPSWREKVRLSILPGDFRENPWASVFLEGAESPSFVPFLCSARGYAWKGIEPHLWRFGAGFDPRALLNVRVALELPLVPLSTERPLEKFVQVAAAVEAFRSRGLAHGSLLRKGALEELVLLKPEPQVYAFGPSPEMRFAFESDRLVVVRDLGSEGGTAEGDERDVLRLFSVRTGETLEGVLREAPELERFRRDAATDSEVLSRALLIDNLFTPGSRRVRGEELPDLVEHVATSYGAVERVFHPISRERQEEEIGAIERGLGYKAFQAGTNWRRRREPRSRLLLQGETHLPFHSYSGPGTRTNLEWVREFPPFNDVDACTREHDLAFDRIKFETDEEEAEWRSAKEDAEARNCVERYPGQKGQRRTLFVLGAKGRATMGPEDLEERIADRFGSRSSRRKQLF